MLCQRPRKVHHTYMDWFFKCLPVAIPVRPSGGRNLCCHRGRWPAGAVIGHTAPLTSLPHLTIDTSLHAPSFPLHTHLSTGTYTDIFNWNVKLSFSSTKCWMRSVKMPGLACAAGAVCVLLNSQVPSQKLSIFCHRAGLHIPGFLLAERTCYIVSFPLSNEPPEYGRPESRNAPSTNTHSDIHKHTRTVCTHTCAKINTAKNCIVWKL